MPYLPFILATALCYTLVPTTANAANCTSGAAGVNPYKCAPDQDMIENMCYPKCPAGYQRKGAVCRQNCPDGFREIDDYCRLYPSLYSRGLGYPWKFSDGFSDRGMRTRCEQDHGVNKCEKWLAMYYPKCKPGYIVNGCCRCRATKLDCNEFGMGANAFVYSCKRKVQAANETALNPSFCDDDKELINGLCYKKC